MKRFLLPFLLLITCHITTAQTIVSGDVRDAKNNPVSGVSIAIKDSYDGATTDSAGAFSFTTTEKGDRVITATSIGYKPFEQNVHIATAPVKVVIVLKEEVSELKAVVISAGAFEASDKKRTTVLSSIDIATTASANADITAAIKTLPGTQQVGESEGLFVRGGTAAETKVFIDGSLVNNFYFSSVPDIAQRGRFSPFIFKGTVFSAGGYSALYGQALSSALILESIDMPDRSSASLGLSPIGVNAGYQYVSKDKKWSWGASYGYTALQLAFKIFKQKPEYIKIPRFHTGDANFRIKTSKTGILKYYGYVSQNALALRHASIDTSGYKEAFSLTNYNFYHNLSWRQNIGSLWKINAGMAYTSNKDQIEGDLQNKAGEAAIIEGLEYKNFDLVTHGHYFNAKVVGERRWKGLSAVRFGSEYNYSRDQSHYILYNGQPYTNTLQEQLASAFAETDIYVTNDLAAKVGTRVEHSSLLHQFNIAPRLSLAYKLGKEGQASLAYGIFYQNPENKYLPAPSALTFTRATHYIAQYQKVTSQVTFRAEAFYKKYNNLLKTQWINGKETGVSNNGYGVANGVELFWRDRKSIKNFDYWLSYSYLDTRRDFLNFPYAIQPNFASKHTTSLVVKKFITGLKTQFNASYTYASPRPYYHIRFDDATSQFRITDGGNTVPYRSLSISVNYLPNVFAQGANKFTVFVLSFNNVLGNKQIFGYQYSANGLRKEAIVPPTTRFIYAGVFISFGVDRSQDVINSNL